MEKSSVVEYDWDETTGIATIMSQTVSGARSTVTRAQPANRSHVGWAIDPHVRAFIDDGVPFPTARF